MILATESKLMIPSITLQLNGNYNTRRASFILEWGTAAPEEHSTLNDEGSSTGASI